MDYIKITSKTKKMLAASIVGILVVIAAVIASIVFEFGIVGNLVMSWILTTAYAIFAFFLVDPIIRVNPTQVVEKPVVKEVIRFIETPVYRDIQIPVENKIIEVVEKPVIKLVPFDKPIIRIVERKHRRLNIPKFNFIGSKATRTYHKRTCKFSKMLKNKYKLHSNTKAFFKKKHYHACESCINKKPVKTNHK